MLTSPQSQTQKINPKVIKSELFQCDSKGFTADTECGNCHCVYPMFIYPDKCPNPKCQAGGGQCFRFAGPSFNVIFAGGLPLSLWEDRQRLLLNPSFSTPRADLPPVYRSFHNNGQLKKKNGQPRKNSKNNSFRLRKRAF